MPGVTFPDLLRRVSPWENGRAQCAVLSQGQEIISYQGRVKMNFKIPYPLDRRQFLLNVLPAGSLFFFGCSGLLASGIEERKASGKKDRFLQDSLMSFKEVLEFAFRDNFIPVLRNLEKSLGNDKFFEMLKQASSEKGALQAREWAETVPKNDLATFTSVFKNPYRFWTHTCAYDILQYSDKTVEVKYTECLWADVFRDAGAADIGYAAFCHGDFAVAGSCNPKIRLIRTKTLMEGNDCCNHRYVFEG